MGADDRMSAVIAYFKRHGDTLLTLGVIVVCVIGLAGYTRSVDNENEREDAVQLALIVRNTQENALRAAENRELACSITAFLETSAAINARDPQSANNDPSLSAERRRNLLTFLAAIRRADC
jgi:hypothetical protein